MTTKVTIENPEGNEGVCILHEYESGELRHITHIPPGAKTEFHIYADKKAVITESPQGEVYGKRT